jgi:hypothetical protein
VGVGDVGAVSCWARARRDTSGGDDGWGTEGERDEGVVGGHNRTEQNAASQPRRDRIDVDDGTRGEHGACDVHRTGSGGAHGMRGHGVGVGDVVAVSCGARDRRDAAGGDDGGITGRQHEPGVVSRWGYAESAPWVEPCRDRRGVYDRAR